MFPLYDISERKRIPYVNYLLIVINIIIFIVQLTQPNFDDFVHLWGFIPILFDHNDPQTYLYIFTSMFLHGSVLHLVMNMWFLHIFGDNVEDRLGHLAYLIFYLCAGVAATIAQLLFIRNVNIPLIGASGAISGVAGAYLLFQASSRVVTLVPVGAFISRIQLPAWVFLIYWFALQVLSGLGTLQDVDYNTGGVAWWAHVGGFLFGVGMGLILRSITREKRSIPAS